ncbi:hypothetical protein Dsin_017801 [Dipteronia sinensis]|uniref:Reverse transcriptase zinc-binding domain-containing protein n=1 Tax=Dipteronia sinensis TaxID=43782 RepID=A0AAE0E792_9ROSI|nr:hypothetical protein Dsin_017801 [Dipteronia sinensis]
MEDKNRSLLAKWIWRFGSEVNSLWRRVICAKYGVSMEALKWDWNGGCCSSPFIKAVASLLIEGSCFGEGENGQLKSACPRIYALSIHKQGAISNFRKWLGSQWVWEVPLRKPLFDWEKEHWRMFLSCLDCINVRNSASDIQVWVNSPDGIFSVRSFQKSLEEGTMIKDAE